MELGVKILLIQTYARLHGRYSQEPYIDYWKMEGPNIVHIMSTVYWDPSSIFHKLGEIQCKHEEFTKRTCCVPWAPTVAQRKKNIPMLKQAWSEYLMMFWVTGQDMNGWVYSESYILLIHVLELYHNQSTRRFWWSTLLHLVSVYCIALLVHSSHSRSPYCYSHLKLQYHGNLSY